MNKYFKIFAFFIIIFSTSMNNAMSQNFSELPNVSTIYSQSTIYLHPQYKLFVTDNYNAEVYMKLNISELNFIQLIDKNFQAKIKIKYIFYKSLENTEIIDSSSEIYTLNKRNLNESIITKFNIVVPQDYCFLVIITQDLYNKKKSLNFIRIENLKSSSANFLLLDSTSNLPVFYDFIKPYKTYIIKSNLNFDSLLVKQFKIDSVLPKPPYSSSVSNTDLKLDTSFYRINSYYLKFNSIGNYQIIDKKSNISFNLINLGEYYPNILTADEMIPSLKYIASDNEFENLQLTANKKLAVDNFWLKKNTDPTKAKNLIKFYYTRVLLANLYFTSDRQGSLTDRGMVYIVFGAPSIIHKADQAEEWIYTDVYNSKRASFVFRRNIDKNNIENYILDRNSSYNEIWKKAVEEWNKGNIYSF